MVVITVFYPKQTHRHKKEKREHSLDTSLVYELRNLIRRRGNGTMLACSSATTTSPSYTCWASTSRLQRLVPLV